MLKLDWLLDVNVRIAIPISAVLLFAACNSDADEYVWPTDLPSSIAIPVNGNSWYIGHTTESISPREGFAKLTTDTMRTYFSIKEQGDIYVALVARSISSKAEISATLGAIEKKFTFTSPSFDTIAIGKFSIKDPGYNFIDLVQQSQSSDVEIKDVIISGTFDPASANFVKDEFYWGKRGPSVHLTYTSAADERNVEWFYNEVTIPESNDVMGSFFMAIGFGEGYFGIQINSESERRVLFSVWSPYSTDNPQEIPEDQRIQLLKKGDEVTTNKFGGEGSGGQSYLKYMWKAGSTYKFLLNGKPAPNNSTDFTAYFYSAEENEWRLIASFRRPQTSTYLKRFHSFLENFIPKQGKEMRMGLYANQWVCDVQGQWTEATTARFTADNTARKGARIDYSGGVIDGKFFMKNCGFFSETTEIGSEFTRPATNRKPDIDFSQLP